MKINYENLNSYENYLELTMGNFSIMLKNQWNKFIAFFKTKNEAVYDDYFQRKVNELKEIEDDYQSFLNLIEKVTKEVIKNNKQEISHKLINEEENEINIPKPKFSDIKKEVMKRISKGFVPSATFYPAFKLFEQFFLILNKEIKISEFNINLNSSEMLAITSFIFIYFFYKLVKETYILKKEIVEKKLKEIEHDKTRKEQIKKRVKKVEQKLWTQEQMDEWLQQKLWSPEELERMIDMKLKEKLPIQEDGLYESYLTTVMENSETNKIKKFVEKIKKIKEKGITYKQIENIVINLTSSLTEEEYQNLINQIKQVPMNEGVKDFASSSVKKIKEFGKRLVKEVFPAFSFYPALSTYMIIDKGLQHGFDSLTHGDKNQLALYVSMFVGIIGSKLAIDRINEKRNKRIEKEKRRIETEKIIKNRERKKRNIKKASVMR